MRNKVLFWHINRTMHTGRPETLTSHDINIVLFNHLRINPMWRNYEDERTAHLFVGWIPTRGWNLHQCWVSLELWPRFHFQSDLVDAIRRGLRRVWHWREIRQLEREIVELSEHADAVCSDPMNGCPEDFREYFDRRLHYTLCELDALKG